MVPALRWGTPFQLLFALACDGGLACLHRLALSVHRLRHILRECLEYPSGKLLSSPAARKRPCSAYSSVIVLHFSSGRL